MYRQCSSTAYLYQSYISWKKKVSAEYKTLHISKLPMPLWISMILWAETRVLHCSRTHLFWLLVEKILDLSAQLYLVVMAVLQDPNCILQETVRNKEDVKLYLRYFIITYPYHFIHGIECIVHCFSRRKCNETKTSRSSRGPVIDDFCT